MELGYFKVFFICSSPQFCWLLYHFKSKRSLNDLSWSKFFKITKTCNFYWGGTGFISTVRAKLACCIMKDRKTERKKGRKRNPLPLRKKTLLRKKH